MGRGGHSGINKQINNKNTQYTRWRGTEGHPPFCVSAYPAIAIADFVHVNPVSSEPAISALADGGAIVVLGAAVVGTTVVVVGATVVVVVVVVDTSGWD